MSSRVIRERQNALKKLLEIPTNHHKGFMKWCDLHDPELREHFHEDLIQHAIASSNNLSTKETTTCLHYALLLRDCAEKPGELERYLQELHDCNPKLLGYYEHNLAQLQKYLNEQSSSGQGVRSGVKRSSATQSPRHDSGEISENREEDGRPYGRMRKSDNLSSMHGPGAETVAHNRHDNTTKQSTSRRHREDEETEFAMLSLSFTSTFVSDEGIHRDAIDAWATTRLGRDTTWKDGFHPKTGEPGYIIRSRSDVSREMISDLKQLSQKLLQSKRLRDQKKVHQYHRVGSPLAAPGRRSGNLAPRSSSNDLFFEDDRHAEPRHSIFGTSQIQSSQQPQNRLTPSSTRDHTLQEVRATVSRQWSKHDIDVKAIVCRKENAPIETLMSKAIYDKLSRERLSDKQRIRISFNGIENIEVVEGPSISVRFAEHDETVRHQPCLVILDSRFEERYPLVFGRDLLKDDLRQLYAAIYPINPLTEARRGPSNPLDAEPIPRNPPPPPPKPGLGLAASKFEYDQNVAYGGRDRHR